MSIQVNGEGAELGEAEGAGAKVPYQDELVRITRSFNAGAGFTAASILPALDEARKFAAGFRKQAAADRSPAMDKIRKAFGATPGTVRQQIRRDLGKAIGQLDYLVKHLQGKGQAPYIFKAGHKTFQDVKQAMLVPYMLASTWSDVIHASNANSAELFADLKTGLKNVPSTIVGGAINYLVDQTRKSLPDLPRLPWWVPVLGVTAVGGVLLAPFVPKIVEAFGKRRQST